MANAYIHLDSVDTLEQYRHKLQDWKEKIYAIKAEMEHYHRSLEQDPRAQHRLREFPERRFPVGARERAFDPRGFPNGGIPRAPLRIHFAGELW